MVRNTVLIVADRHPASDLNTRFLRQSELRVVQCPSDARVLGTIRQERPDLVIEDLPGERTPGSSICRRIKSDPRTGTIPTIVVATRGRMSDVRDIGADEVLCKPLVPSVFYEAVRNYVPLPQRCQPRHAVNLRFMFEIDGRAVQAFSRNISLAGAFIKTDRSARPGSHLELTFALPGDALAVHCGGRVRRIDDDSKDLDEHGIGIEFEGILDSDLERLESYITRSSYSPGFFR